MSIEFENKYVVIKRDDIEKYLSNEGKKALYHCLDSLIDSRRHDGKQENNYLVINTNEPYAGEIAQIMQRHGHFTPGGAIGVWTEKADELDNGREFITKEQAYEDTGLVPAEVIGKALDLACKIWSEQIECCPFVYCGPNQLPKYKTTDCDTECIRDCWREYFVRQAQEDKKRNLKNARHDLWKMRESL